MPSFMYIDELEYLYIIRVNVLFSVVRLSDYITELKTTQDNKSWVMSSMTVVQDVFACKSNKTICLNIFL